MRLDEISVEYPFDPTPKELTSTGKILSSLLDDMDSIFSKTDRERGEGESIHDDQEILQDAYLTLKAIHEHHKKAKKDTFVSNLKGKESDDDPYRVGGSKHFGL